MDNITLAKSIFEAEDFQPLLEHLADDVVFKATIPKGTPISGEFRGKQAVVDYFTWSSSAAAGVSSCWAKTASRSRRAASQLAASTLSLPTFGLG